MSLAKVFCTTVASHCMRTRLRSPPAHRVFKDLRVQTASVDHRDRRVHRGPWDRWGQRVRPALRGQLGRRESTIAVRGTERQTTRLATPSLTAALTGWPSQLTTLLSLQPRTQIGNCSQRKVLRAQRGHLDNRERRVHRACKAPWDSSV